VFIRSLILIGGASGEISMMSSTVVLALGKISMKTLEPKTFCVYVSFTLVFILVRQETSHIPCGC